MAGPLGIMLNPVSRKAKRGKKKAKKARTKSRKKRATPKRKAVRKRAKRKAVAKRRSAPKRAKRRVVAKKRKRTVTKTTKRGGGTVAKKRRGGKRKTRRKAVSTLARRRRATKSRTPAVKAKWKRRTTSKASRRKARKYFTPSMMTKWTRGVRRTANPMSLAGLRSQIFNMDMLKSVLSASGGALLARVGPDLIEEYSGFDVTSGYRRDLTAVGLTVAGYALLRKLGYAREGTMFVVGSGVMIVLPRILELAGFGGMAGLGATNDVRQAVEDEVARTLAAEGLGEVTVPDVAELGAVTAEDMEELDVGVAGLD